MMRKPVVAGGFYPADPDELKKMMERYIDEAPPPKIKGKLKGLIVPHAGYIYSGPVAAYAYKLLKEENPGKIVLIGPSHYAYFRGLAESGHEEWETPLGKVKTFSLGGMHTYPAAHDPEHSLEVQLPFLQLVLKDFTVAPILTGDVSPSEGAGLLDKGHFLLVSSDLSHYQPYTDAVERDKRTIGLIESLDVDGFLGQGDACGKAGIAIAMAMAKKHGWRIRLLHYANSGDTAGPKTGVVGYAAMAIEG